MEVFLLWHVHVFPGGEEDAKLIGVYSSHELAELVQQRALKQPGFRDTPTGFCIDCYSVDEDHWLEGYVTQTHKDLVRQRVEGKANQPAVPALKPREERET
jgi:homoserine kinase type II